MHQTTLSPIEAIRSGNNTYITAIYQEYRQPFISWIKNEFNCSEDDAIEFFQTAVVILYDNIISGKLTELNSNIKTYLFGIGKNKAHEWLRHKQKQGSSVDDLLIQYIQEDAPGTDEAEFADNLRKVETGMNALGEPCRTLLQLFYYYKASMREICEKLEYKNEDTAKNQKYKCLKRLQALCGEEKNIGTFNT
jgi:RNA polymerase sigma-70 factor (ECF subfamily)